MSKGERMKKIFIVLFTSLFTLAAVAQEPSYEIDSEATAKAPWEVGETLVENYGCFVGVECYTAFLGFSENSAMGLVQDYYPSGAKMSDPYWVDAATYLITELHDAELPFREVGYYFESGQKLLEGQFAYNLMIGVWREWDEQGKLIVAKAFKAPKE